MRQPATLERLEAELDDLSWSEQILLLERLARRIRERTPNADVDMDRQLAAMADDPDIQRELREIASEFAATEADRLP
jgi:hypothetical protein